MLIYWYKAGASSINTRQPECDGDIQLHAAYFVRNIMLAPWKRLSVYLQANRLTLFSRNWIRCILKLNS
ncbi:MAG: hypothetical protein CSA50_03365 [Gammaproteobacteria bacterium]|nr:MAG: hypothetical protein CSA50_03365 [Gammaproteobacteria bacterium]